MEIAFTCRIDGRRTYIEQTIESVERYVNGPPFAAGFIIDDSGDPEFAAWLDTTFPWLTCIHHEQRRGLGGCFKSALDAVLSTPCDWAWMVEDDTPMIGHFSIAAMADVLNTNPQCAQLMLSRPPFNQAEIDAGGVFQQNPNIYSERSDGTHRWVTHESHYGFQPHLVKREVIQYMVDHPSDYLEMGVTSVLKPAGYHFGYWGGLTDSPLCDHVGRVRSQGYHW